MTDRIPPATGGPHEHLPTEAVGSPGPDPYRFGPEPEEEGGGLSLGRIGAALLRYRWLVITAAILGVVAAILVYQNVDPEYRVEGAIWVNVEAQNSQIGGPIAQTGLLEQTAWIELLKSYAVLDPVVVEERLFVETPDAYRPLFQDFTLAERFRTGQYELEVTDQEGSWVVSTEEGVEISRGQPGDSLDTEFGLLWVPPTGSLEAETTIPFRVVNPRDAATSLYDRLQAEMDRRGNFIRLGLSGTNPERITDILQAVMEQHVSVAAELKSAKLEELTSILREQLASVQSELEQAENQLESFRVRTATLPVEESAPITPGLEQTRGSVFTDYFDRRVELETLTRNLDRLRAVLDSIPQGVRVESYELIPAARASSQLQGALEELTSKRAELRSLLQRYTEDYQPVVDLRDDIRTLEEVTIPRLTRSLIAEMETREAELRRVLDERAVELEEIPPRMIEEARLERRQAIADQLYVELRNRYETARLAAASSIPDIRILDDATVPSVPATDQRLPMAGVAFLGILGLGLVAAVFMDRSDPRFRYLTDVSEDMGLEILGVVPRLRTGRRENSHAVFEAFREIRMRTEFAHGTAHPIVLSVTSPDTEEGKTFVSANLAISFAQLGRATLLVDGDTRRGDLHELFDQERKPGLTDLLEGKVRQSVIRATAYESLDLLTSGSRRAASPELLSSNRMQQLLGAVKPRYDVIIMDSPPMAAGSDAFVLGAHAGNLLLVLRSGNTHKDLAKGKLETFLRLPVRILGGVLNDIEENDAAVGSYRYHSYYLPDYVTRVDEPDEDERNIGFGDGVASAEEEGEGSGASPDLAADPVGSRDG